MSARAKAPKITPAQRKALHALPEPMNWDLWKGHWRRQRSEWLRKDVMWRCVSLKLVERAPGDHSPFKWQLTAAGRAAITPAPSRSKP